MTELTWQGQAEWDSAQERAAVVSRSFGGFSGDTLRLGWDPQYGPLADAANYWPLTGPNDTSDLKGGHTPTINGTDATAGVFGMDALEFNPENDDYIDLGNPDTYDHADDLTVMAHVRVPDPSSGHKYIAGYARGWSDTEDGFWILYVRPLDNSSDADEWEIGWFFRQHGDWEPGVFQRRELTPYEDHVIAATFDFDSQLATVTVDGHHESQQIHDHRDNPTWAAEAAIGDRAPGSERYFDGNLSHFAYWSRSLDHSEREEVTTPSSGGSLITAPKTDDLAAIELTTDAAVGGARHVDVSVYQDVDGNGEPDNSQTVALDNGQNTYELKGFEQVDGADYWIEVDLETTDLNVTPELYSVTVTTGTPDDVLIPVDDRLTWERQAEWDRAQDRARVVTREYGSHSPHSIELGHDPEYGPVADAAFFAPLDETTSRTNPTDVISGEQGTFGGSPALSVAGGVGTTGMFSGGSSEPGYATWETMEAFEHGGARTIAALINAEAVDASDEKGVIIGAGVANDGAEWTLELRDGQRLIFRYTSGIPWWKSTWDSKTKETVLRTFHSDFSEGPHAIVFVFDQEQEETEVRGGKYWTIIESADIDIALSGDEIEIASSDVRIPRSRRFRHGHHHHHHRNKYKYKPKWKYKMPRYKWWRGRRRKVAALGLCFLDKILDIKKLVLPLPEPESPPTVRIGRHPTQSCRDYHGLVDEVLYWDRALGEEEVNEIRRTYEDGHLTTAPKESFGEAIEVVTDVDRPARTSIELTVHQDTSGNGESNRSQTVTVPDGDTTIGLDRFEAVEGADYWLEWELSTRDKTRTPTIHSAYLNLSGVTGSVIDTDQNGVITTDEFGSIDTVE